MGIGVIVSAMNQLWYSLGQMKQLLHFICFVVFVVIVAYLQSTDTVLGQRNFAEKPVWYVTYSGLLKVIRVRNFYFCLILCEHKCSVEYV